MAYTYLSNPATFKLPTNTYRNNPDEDDEDDDAKLVPLLNQKRKPYQLYEEVFNVRQFHVYISEVIGAPEEYTELFYKISAASSNDVIYVHLNTGGGRLDTGVQFINAMRNTNAKVVTILESTAYSMGTLIFLSGDEMIIHESCMMMFHNFRGGILGKGNELVAELEATVKWFSSIAKKIYVPFLSEQEFESLLKGEDIWMQSAEIRKRLEKVSKLYQEEEDKRQEQRSKRNKKRTQLPAKD